MSAPWILYSLDSLDPSSLDSLHHLYPFIRHDEEEQYSTGLQGAELARLVDFLDEALSTTSVNDDISRQCLHRLQAICGHHATLPSSYIISSETARVGYGLAAPGTIADVWQGTYRGKKVTIKCLLIHAKNYQTIKQSLFKGAVMWKRLRHPNIVPFIGVTTNPLQIVSEWMPNQTLTGFIERNPGTNRISLLLDVAEGLNYLHANHVIHGNLNGPSILVDHNGHARLTDFGFPSIVPGVNPVTQEKGYTAARTAPEILEGAYAITQEADVFAFGMVVIEVFTGRSPVSEFATRVIISKIMDGERPARPREAQELGLTDSMWDMTIRCLHQDPVQRPMMVEVVGLVRECYRMATFWTTTTDIPVKLLTPEDSEHYEMHQRTSGSFIDFFSIYHLPMVLFCFAVLFHFFGIF